MTASTDRSRSGRSASSGTRYGILASRILRLARTSRCAMVASGTRNAREISAVSRPPSRRRVSATWASTASAGWQQVNMSRSRSSCTGPTSSTGSSPASIRTACRWRSSRDDSRRRRSIALLRAVVRIQPPGLGGLPATGQRSAATTNASWTASSARSMSPKRRIRVATTLPRSSRKMRSSAVDATVTAAQPSGSSWKGRTSTSPRQASAPFLAHASASSRSLAWMTQKPPRNSLVSA